MSYKPKKVKRVQKIDPSRMGGTSLHGYIKTSRTELRKTFGNPNMGPSGDGKVKSSGWVVSIDGKVATIYDRRDADKKGDKFFHIGGRDMFAPIVVAQELSKTRGEKVHAIETSPEWDDEKRIYPRGHDFPDSHPIITPTRAMEYSKNVGRYRAEGEEKTRTFKITDIWYDTYDEEYELWDGQEFIDKHGYKQTSEQPDPSEMTITLDEDDLDLSGFGELSKEDENQIIEDMLLDRVSDESGFMVYHWNYDEIFPESKSAEGLEFTDWANQETKHHGKTSLKDWADHEIKSHGKSMSFQDWAKHEDKSHIRRFGAEEIWCDNCGEDGLSGDFHVVTSMPVDFDSGSAGESATLCGDCYSEYGAEGEPEPYEKIWDDYPEPLEDWEIEALQRDLPPREVAIDEGTYEWIQENTNEDAFDRIMFIINFWFNKYQKCKDGEQGQFGAEDGEPCPSCSSCSHKFYLKDTSVQDEEVWVDVECEKCRLQAGGYADLEVDLEPATLRYNRTALNIVECPNCNQGFTLNAENWGGDPKGKLAQALAKAREKAKKVGKTLKIEKLGAETSGAKAEREDSWEKGVIRLAISDGCFSDEYAEWVLRQIDGPYATMNHPRFEGISYWDKVISQAETSGQWEIGEQLEEAQMNAEEFDRAIEDKKGHINYWGEKDRMQKYFKNWKPKSSPYEKRVVAETKSKWCENCEELDDNEEENWPWYQWVLKQKNSSKASFRWITGGACEGCGSDLCQNCLDGNTSGNFNPLFEPTCEDCGGAFCKECKDEDEDRCNTCQEEYEENVCDCCGYLHHAESFEAQAPRGHKMMTAALGKKIPPMDSQEGMGDEAIVYAHYFNPYGMGEWWILEWDGKDEMFGYADLGFPELGYISLSELENVSIGGMELPIERDLHWREKTLGEVKQAVSKYRAESFSATKGIDTFTEPFDELSLDSGNIKKVIVGIGIGVAGILAYSKWK